MALKNWKLDSEPESPIYSDTLKISTPLQPVSLKTQQTEETKIGKREFATLLPSF